LTLQEKPGEPLAAVGDEAAASEQRRPALDRLSSQHPRRARDQGFPEGPGGDIAAPSRYRRAVKRSVQVEIAGQQLTIRSDEGADYVHQLADYVDAHLKLLSGGRRITNSTGLQRVALLVAMQLADELFREKDLHQRFRRKVGDKLEVLRRALDEHEQRLAAMQDPPRDTPGQAPL